MAIFDEEPTKRPTQHVLGEDLSRLSLNELEERLDLLRAEIARLEAARATKSASAAVAEAVFGRR
jgi:uncharacterized small protein (DUF1192 family)